MSDEDKVIDAINRMVERGMEKITEAGVFPGDWVRYSLDENGELTITRVPPEEVYITATPSTPSPE